MNDVDRRALGYGVIALVAIFTIYMNVIPAHDLANVLSRMEPAAGRVSGTDVDRKEAARRASMYKIYAAEQTCEYETNLPCEWVLCEGDRENHAFITLHRDEMREKICSEQEWTGWRPTGMPEEKQYLPLTLDAIP